MQVWHCQAMRAPLPLIVVLLAFGCGTDSDPKTDSDLKSDSGEIGPLQGTLRVLTYNVAGLPDGVSSAEGALLDRMPAIQALLADYDLVGLQEDFDATGHAALTDGTSHAEVLWFSDTVGSDRVYGAGLAQLLPQASAGYREEHYTDCNGVFDGASDCLASKGFQTSTLMLGGEALDVLNTHHEAGGGLEDEAARLAQVDQVLAAIDTHSTGRAILMTGDFNLRPGDVEDAVPLARYDDAGLVRACDWMDCAEPNHIDQIRVRSSDTLSLEVLEWDRPAQFVTEDGVALSDHPAVSAVIAWEVVGR